MTDTNRGLALACRGVCLDYGTVRALDEVDLEVGEGEVLAILGESGSGKTSLLYAIAGFVPIAAGEIELSGRLVATANRSAPPENRSVGMVFQNYALWPHLDAVDTVGYPLRRAGVAKPEARRRALELLEKMEIGVLRSRRPAEMSGGQQQRVGLARALAREALLYLFDEPTAHLDAGVRLSIQAEIAQRREETGAAAIYATHDAGEALAVADRVAILRQGRLVQVASPQQVYEQPADLEMALLTGPAFLLTADVDARGRASIEGVPITGTFPVGKVTLLVRPDWVEPVAEEGLEGAITALWYRGPHTDYRVATTLSILEVRLRVHHDSQ